MTTIKLPTPLPSSHQDLINLFQETGDRINAELPQGVLYATRADIASVMPPKINMAAMLAALNYQVENGGFAQWYGNDYWREGRVIVPFLKAAADLGIEGAAKIHEIVASAVEELGNHDASGSSSFSYISFDNDDDEDVERGLCDKQDASYYAIDNCLEIYQQMLDQFDEIVAHRLSMFFSNGFRQAA